MNWTWILLGLGFLVGAGLVAYNVFFVEEEDEEDEEREKATGYDGTATMIEGGADADTLGETLLSTSEEMRGARKSRMLALKDSLERSLEGKEGAGAEATDRLSMPWFLLIGAGGSGKTTMLANTGLPLPYGPAFEVDSRKRDAGRWWLFEDSVVLEAPPASAAAGVSDSTLPPGQTIASDTSEGWNTLLHMLRRERPDAPLNGIIVTVSCADLVAGGRDSEKLAETGDRIRAFLEKTRNVLEVRLPLHVLVTKCDVLPGFRSFADNLPDSRRHDIFGWANPNKLEAPFNPSWVDVGCDALKKELEDLRDEVLAAPDEIKDADGLFVFVNEFSNLQEPLRDFVSRLYHEDEKRPSLFFRGMYFCGDTIEPEVAESITKEQEKAGKTRATMQLSAEVALTGTTAAHNLVFLRSLFTEKIFKEAGLARPVARFRLSRDRRVVIAQIAAAMIAVVGGAGLWTTVNGFQRGDTVVQRGLRADAEALAHALAGMAIDLDEMKRGGAAAAADASFNRRVRDAAVIELVDEMRSLHTIKRSPFIPASWFSELPRDVTTSMEAGIQDIVLPVIRQRLEERARALLDSSAADTASGTEAVMANPRILADYLGEVRTLSRHVTQYNRLARVGSGGLADLASLLDYLFGMQLDNTSGVTSEDFQSALRAANAPAITLSPQVATTVVSRSMHLVSSLGEEAGRQLSRPRNLQAERAIDPEADLRALRQLGTLVELSDIRRGIVATVSDSSILGTNLARLVQDSIAAQLRSAAVQISGDSGAANEAALRLRSVIDTLFTLHLMDAVEPREIVADFGPNQRLRWDVGSLELALTMRGEYVRAVLTVNQAMPRQTPDRLRRAFDVQLRARVLAVAGGAQRLTSINAGFVPTVEVKQGAANLDAAADRLFRLGTLLDTLKAGAEGKRLIAAATRQAEQTIGLAQWVIETDNSLLPQPANVAAWQGVIPLNWASVGVTDSLRFEGARLPLEGLVRSLTGDITPALRFLGRLPSADVRLPKLVTEWSALAANIAKYDRGDGTSTVSGLRRYLIGELATRDLESCGAVAAQADTTKPSPDPFTRRRRMFRAALAARCGTGAAEAVAAYQKLRTLFQTRLAGRYPFVDSTQAQAPDADPAILRDFLAQYDAFMTTGDISLRSEAATAVAAKGALDFLAAMAPIRAFLAPLVDAEGKKPIEFLVVVPALDSATTRQLSIATRAIPLNTEPHEGLWAFGDPVRVTQRDSNRTRQVFASRGNWALFALPKQASVRIFHPTTRVELMAPAMFPATAPDIVLARPSKN